MKAVLYARVSTKNQAESELPIDSQLKAIRKYAEDRGWEIVREFKDEGESARSDKRPAFQQIISLAKQKGKPFDIILVWKLSRFARSREDSVIYKSLLRKYGVTVVSINEQIDDSPTSKLLEGIIEVIDEFYSTNLAQDTLRGMKENCQRGFINGGVAPIGYKLAKKMDGKNERTIYTKDEVLAPVITRIFKLSASGIGAKEIVKQLNDEGSTTNRGKLWHKNRVLAILKNETYTGTLIWNKRNKSTGKDIPKDPKEIYRIENNHPALIDKETYNTVQQFLKNRTFAVTHPRSVNSDYMLSGLAVCGKCGSRIIGGSAKSNSYQYYTCQNYSKRGKNVCDARAINRTKLEEFIISKIKDAILDEQHISELVALTNSELQKSIFTYQEKLANITANIAQLSERLKKLFDAIETGKLDISDSSARIKELREKIAELEGQRSDIVGKMEGAKEESIDADFVRAKISDLKELLQKGTRTEQKAFIRTFVKKITVNKPQVTINYTIPPYKSKTEPLNIAVPRIIRSGSSGRARTYNNPVNSRGLYH